MKLIGMLIMLGGVLALVYYLAGDIDSMLGGRGEDAKLAPARITSEATDKVNEDHEAMKSRLNEITK